MLTLALSFPTEAATTYTFARVALGQGEDPEATVVTLAGVRADGLLVGEFVRHDQPGSEQAGFHGLGSQFRLLPRLTPKAVNKQGTVVGNFTDAYNLDAPEAGFLMSGTRFQALSVPGASMTRIYGVNNAGIAVGCAWLGGQVHAVRRAVDGTWTVIDPPFGRSAYCAHSINTTGDLVGQYGSLGWSLIGGVYKTIQMPGNDGNTMPLTINDKRQIGGVFCSTDEFCSGFLLINGQYQPIDVPDAYDTQVVGIEPTGRLAVNANTGNGLRGYRGVKAVAGAPP